MRSAPDTAGPFADGAEAFPRLSDADVERMTPFGAVEDLPKGTVLFRRDDRGVDFFLVLRGNIEIYDQGPDGEPRVFTVHAERQFTGELDLFNDRAILVGGRMGEDGRVVRMSRARFRRMLAAEPDIATVVMRAFMLRREGFIRNAQATVTVVSAPRSGEGLRIRRFLTRNGYPFVALDPEREAEAAGIVAANGLDEDDLPAVVCAGERLLRRPSTRELGDCLGISEPIDPAEVYDVAVVGGGPSGLAAAVYAASEGLRTLVIEAEAPGGQAGTSSRIENYLGFPTGISGQELAGRAEVQAQKFGAHIAVPRRAVRLAGDGPPYTVELDDGSTATSRAVVVATGARYRRLDDVPDLDRFEGGGIHYGATAVEAGLCEGEEVVVVGGGNSAGQAAVFLSRTAARVHVLIRGPQLAAGMSDYLVSRIEASPERIALHTETEVVALGGDRHLESVTWADRRTGTRETRPIANVFLMLGARPNTDWLEGAVELDDKGFVRVGNDVAAVDGRRPSALETNLPGVFAVGDVRADSVKRVASAVGEGSVVVSYVHQALAATVE